MKDKQPNFDLVARPYRWLEYLSFGRCLERCRFHFLAELADRRSALVLGDGDGRFTARLLAANSRVSVDAVDSSAEMLRLLRERVARLGSSASSRLRTMQVDALQFDPEARTYDLVVTHFFLDCLRDQEIDALLARIAPNLAPEPTWLISEFSIPIQQPARWVAQRIVSLLYLAFGILTGLETRRLPAYAKAFRRCGFRLARKHAFLGGLLVSEMWIWDRPTASNRESGNGLPLY